MAASSWGHHVRGNQLDHRATYDRRALAGCAAYYTLPHAKIDVRVPGSRTAAYCARNQRPSLHCRFQPDQPATRSLPTETIALPRCVSPVTQCQWVLPR
jgi:hypothetical protein